MGLKRDVSLSTALRYKGQGPFLTFILHRIGGMGMAIFVTLHILSTFLAERRWAIGHIINLIYMSLRSRYLFYFAFCFTRLTDCASQSWTCSRNT